MASSTIIEEIDETLEAYSPDQLLQELLFRYDGNAKKLLTATFQFLKQKSSFFNDPDASKVLARLLRDTKGPAAVKPAPSSAPPPPSQRNGIPSSSTPPVSMPPSQPAAQFPNPTEIASSSSAPAAGDSEDEDKADDKPKGLKPNNGNGLDLNTYKWTQTLSEVNLNVPVPKGTKARDCAVEITGSRITVGLKGSEAIISGELCKPVQADETLWSLDNSVIEIALQKKDRQNWWNSIIAGQDVIDSSKIEPESSKLSDLDGETRATVEKMMYDQRQKQMGLPTSEDAKKNDMLKKFMAAHPEMDFSNAKIS